MCPFLLNETYYVSYYSQSPLQSIFNDPGSSDVASIFETNSFALPTLILLFNFDLLFQRKELQGLLDGMGTKEWSLNGCTKPKSKERSRQKTALDWNI